MTVGGKNKIRNHRLWLARKRRSLKQKHVALLLGHRNIDQISRYESGTHLPTLPVALKLAIVLDMPVRLLFRELYDQLRNEVNERAKTSLLLSESLAVMKGDDSCSFSELLASPQPTPEDLEKIRRHATELVKGMAYR